MVGGQIPFKAENVLQLKFYGIPKFDINGLKPTQFSQNRR